ncbi:hypothetical protein D3C75_901090 [compost metagenome]
MLPVFAEDFGQRQLDLRLAGLSLVERRCLGDVEADVQAHGNQQCAGQERDAPAPGKHVFSGQQPGDREEGQVGNHGTGRHADLYP